MVTTIAHIGGVQPKSQRSGPEIGKTIDTYNVDTGVEMKTVAQLKFDRKQFSCALIPKGKDGNPTVAICKKQALLHLRCF